MVSVWKNEQRACGLVENHTACVLLTFLCCILQPSLDMSALCIGRVGWGCLLMASTVAWPAGVSSKETVWLEWLGLAKVVPWDLQSKLMGAEVLVMGEPVLLGNIGLYLPALSLWPCVTSSCKERACPGTAQPHISLQALTQGAAVSRNGSLPASAGLCSALWDATKTALPRRKMLLFLWWWGIYLAFPPLLCWDFVNFWDFLLSPWDSSHSHPGKHSLLSLGLCKIIGLFPWCGTNGCARRLTRRSQGSNKIKNIYEQTSCFDCKGALKHKSLGPAVSQRQTGLAFRLAAAQ